MKAPARHTHRKWGAYGGGANGLFYGTDKPEEEVLDVATINDIMDMYRSSPVIKVARKSFLSMTLSEPFTFSIPAIGLVSNKDMEKIILAYWMPWLRTVYDWSQTIGVVPYFFEKKGKHLIPVVPEMELGYITVVVDEKHHVRYKWYYDHGTSTEEKKDMLWIITENRPTKNGVIRSPLASLLPNYRSLLKLQEAQDLAATQCVRPVHVIEYSPTARAAADDNLAYMSADYGKAAGIGKGRRDAAKEQQVRIQLAEIYKQMDATQRANTGKSNIKPTMWTDTPDDTLREIDYGFGNRVVVMRPDCKYGSAEKPTLVADYYKAESQFNTMAAAVMDFALELLTPTGSSRTQNVQGSERFENERIREQTTFFESVLRPALIIAYRDQFRQGMEDARNWHVAKLGGDPNEVAFLYPELDVVVDLSSSTVTNYPELKEMHMDGYMTKDTVRKHIAKTKNIPLEQLETLDWPDKVPRELLLGPDKDKGDKAKPPKKKKKKKKSTD